MVLLFEVLWVFFFFRKSDINIVNVGFFGIISCIYIKDNGFCGLWYILNWI